MQSREKGGERGEEEEKTAEKEKSPDNVTALPQTRAVRVVGLWDDATANESVAVDSRPTFFDDDKLPLALANHVGPAPPHRGRTTRRRSSVLSSKTILHTICIHNRFCL